MLCLINIYSKELKNKLSKGLEKDSTKEGEYRVERNGFNLVQVSFTYGKNQRKIFIVNVRKSEFYKSFPKE